MDNNNGVLTDFYLFISLYTLPHTSVSLTGCMSNAFSVLNILTHLTTLLLFGSLGIHDFKKSPKSIILSSMWYISGNATA